MLDPAGLFPAGSGDGAVGAALDFVAEEDVRNEEGEEVERVEELVIAAEAWVEKRVPW